MARAATATINLDAIRHNYRLAKSVAPEQQAIAIIKADGYGHGAIKLAEALENEADAFGVACIEEAIELRAAGIQLPILLLEGFFAANELEYISNNNLWCAVHSLFQIDQIAAADITNPITVWLKMDSGMHRLGVQPGEYKEAYDKLVALPQVKEVVLMTHFSSADEPELDTTANQIKLFDETTTGIDAPVSLANSAGTLAHTKARRSWQRPGIMLYGATPFATSQELSDQLKPAMTLSSEVIAIRDLQPGDAVGYSCTWICDKPTRVGTVAMGYADGYPRSAKNGTPVLINGVEFPLVGRVSMDLISVDIGNHSDVKIGDEVTLWGPELPVERIAKYANLIPYELLTGVSKRVRRYYSNTHSDIDA